MENTAGSQPPDVTPLDPPSGVSFTPGNAPLAAPSQGMSTAGVLEPRHSCQISDPSKGKLYQGPLSAWLKLS